MGVALPRLWLNIGWEFKGPVTLFVYHSPDDQLRKQYLQFTIKIVQCFSESLQYYRKCSVLCALMQFMGS